MTNTILILIPSVVKCVCVNGDGGGGPGGLGGGVLRRGKTGPEPMPAAPAALQKVTRPGLLIFTKHQREVEESTRSFRGFPRRQKQYPPSQLGK